MKFQYQCVYTTSQKYYCLHRQITSTVKLGSKLAPFWGSHVLHRVIQAKPLKYSCSKPQALEIRYCVSSIVQLISKKLIQIMALGSKLSYIIKILLKSSCSKPQALELRYLVYSLVDLHIICSNYAPGVKIDSTPGVIYYNRVIQENSIKIFLS